MRTFASVGVAVLSLFFLASPSRAQGIELFGGYSFVHAPVTFVQSSGACPVLGCPTISNTQHLNLNGWNVGGAFKIPQIASGSRH